MIRATNQFDATKALDDYLSFADNKNRYSPIELSIFYNMARTSERLILESYKEWAADNFENHMHFERLIR